MINVEKPTDSFLKLYFNTAVRDFDRINNKKWFKIMSLSVFILNVVSNVLGILDKLNLLSPRLSDLLNVNFLYGFWVVCWLLHIIECFFINWYIGVFCTILIFITFFVNLYPTVLQNRVVIISLVYHFFSSMWLSYLIANFIFTNKTYHFLFFVFTLVFLLLFTLALSVCQEQEWFGLEK